MDNKTPNLTPAELRKFGLVTAIFVIVFFDGLIPWIWGIAPPAWPLVVAALLSFFALVRPVWLNPFYRVWMKFANVLGWINTRIILSLMFFVVILPTGLIMRLRRDPMRRKWDKTEVSYRKKSKPPKTENLKRPY
jgi:predicted membrane protein